MSPGLCLCVWIFVLALEGSWGLPRRASNTRLFGSPLSFQPRQVSTRYTVGSITRYSQRKQGFVQKSLVSLSSSNLCFLVVLQLQSVARVLQSHAVASAQKSVGPPTRPRRVGPRRGTRGAASPLRRGVRQEREARGITRRRLIEDFPIWGKVHEPCVIA